MKLLLDTHAFLWFINGDTRLSATARKLIEDITNDVYLSAGSVWEMAIKVSLGRLELPEPLNDFLEQQLNENNVGLLGITLSHAKQVAALPFHHRDPFDRLLIAQALAEEATLVSDDPELTKYPVKVIW